MEQNLMDRVFDIRSGNERSSNFGDILGFERHETAENSSVIELRLNPSHCNLQGMVHGGVLMAIADVAGFWAGAVQNGVKRLASTASLNCHFVRAARLSDTTSLRAEGHVNKYGKSMYFTTIEVYAYPSEKLVATAQGVFSLAPSPQSDLLEDPLL